MKKMKTWHFQGKVDMGEVKIKTDFWDFWSTVTALEEDNLSSPPPKKRLLIKNKNNKLTVNFSLCTIYSNVTRLKLEIY